MKEAWHKPINELNCHLHPLDSIASSSRTALRQLETLSGKLFGKDCFAANIVVQMDKLRYKDCKGDPRGLKSFLDSEDLTSCATKMAKVIREDSSHSWTLGDLQHGFIPHLWKIHRRLCEISQEWHVVASEHQFCMILKWTQPNLRCKYWSVDADVLFIS